MNVSAKFLFGAMMAGLVAACDSPPPSAARAQSEAVPVPAAEIRSMLAGRTWGWTSSGPGGGIYFAPDGSAVIHHEGRNHDTTWSTRDGAFCYQHPRGDRCWVVARRDGALISRSLWQAEHPNEYVWDYEGQVRRGRHLG